MLHARRSVTEPPPREVSSEDSSATSPAIIRWKAPLLTLTTHSFMLMTVTGFGVFFLRGIIIDLEPIGLLHTVVSVALLLPVALYLRRHLARVWALREGFSGRLGIGSLIFFITVTITGATLLLREPSDFMRLFHTVFSFAFLIVLSAHLFVVGFRFNERPEIVRSLLMRHLVWPLTLGTIVVVGYIALS